MEIGGDTKTSTGSSSNMSTNASNQSKNAGNTTSKFDTNTKSQTSTINIKSGVIYGLPETINGELLGHDYSLKQDKNFIIAEITPGTMQYNNSQNIVNAWDFKPASGKFISILTKLLSDAGVSPNYTGAPPFKFALVDFTANEAINNNYSDSALQSANDMASSLVKEYAYMSNGNMDTFTNMLKNNLNGMDKGLGDKISNIASTFNNLTGAGDVLKSLKNSSGTVGALMSGYRVDLPKIWKNTQNEKIYTLKIQLSSAVDNENAMIDRMLVPYAILLGLASPLSNKSYLYQWPFVVSLKIPGIVHIPLGAVTSLQITKPGEHGMMSHNAKMLSMTITLSIASLYSTQFIVEEGSLPSSMLTVNDELKTVADGFKM